MSLRTRYNLWRLRRFLTPERFTQFRLAKDADGIAVDPAGSEATTFCVMGAMIHLGIADTSEIVDILRQRAYWIHGMPLTSVNDDLGYEAVRRLL